jgi:hypothetical protein
MLLLTHSEITEDMNDTYTISYLQFVERLNILNNTLVIL